MLLDKTYTETLDVRDPENFCSNPEGFVATNLHRRFVGRCRKGAFIVAILEVTRRSDCRMKTTDLSAEGYVDVEFRARVSVHGQWDIITGIDIVARGQLVIGRSRSAAVIASLLPTAEAETVRVGQTIAIRVLQVRYSPDQAQATAVGALLTCDRAAPAYLVVGALTREAARDLGGLAGRVKELLAARAELVRRRRADVYFFEALLYAFRAAEGAGQTVETAGAEAWEGPPGVRLSPGATSVNLVEVVDAALDPTGPGRVDVGGVWSRDLALYRSSPLAARAGPAGLAAWAAPVATPPRTALAAMLKTVHDFLQAVGEMAAIYDTPALVEAHRNIWLVMREAQSSPPS